MSDWELEHAYETIDLHRRGGAAKIELNRPEALNAWNKQFGVDLLEVVKRVWRDDEVRAVLIAGAGRGFSSGADLKAGFDPTPDGKPDVHTTLTERYHPIMTALREMPKPVVASVQGPAVGIGCSLALVADLIVAGESAFSEPPLSGVKKSASAVPGTSSAASSARSRIRAGVRKAAGMIVTGRRSAPAASRRTP